MIRLEIVDGSLQISVAGAIILVAPKDSCAIDVLALYDDVPHISIYNKYLGNSTGIFYKPLADCEDDTGTPFTVNTFITFAEQNLGFSSSANNITRGKTIGNTVYCGFAPTGSLESDAVWTITTITVALNGTTTSITETNQVWTGYDE